MMTTYAFTDRITGEKIITDISQEDAADILDCWHGHIDGARPVIADLLAKLRAGEYAGEEAAYLQWTWE